MENTDAITSRPRIQARLSKGHEPTLVLPFPNDASLRGDVNSDGELDDDDLEDLCAQIAGAKNAAAFDRLVSSPDLDIVLGELGIVAGDADLHGSVGFADFLTLTKRFGKSGSFDQGDFNCPGTVDFPDFLLLSRNFRTTATQAVSEPHSLGLMLLALLGKQCVSRPRRSKG